MSMRQYSPVAVTFAAGDTAPKYIPLDAGTDRHQVHLAFAAAGNAFALAVAAPPVSGGQVPEAADVVALDWLPVLHEYLGTAIAPANSTRFLVVGALKYLRISPNVAGPGQAVRVTYQPLPATSP